MEENFYQITNNCCKQICKSLNITQSNYNSSFLSKLRNIKKSLQHHTISLGHFYPNLRNLGPVCKFHVEPISSGQTSPALSEPEFEEEEEPSIEDVDSRILPANIYEKQESVNFQQRTLLISKISMNADLGALRRLFEENQIRTRIMKCFYEGWFSFIVEPQTREETTYAFNFLQKNTKMLTKILTDDQYEIFFIYRTQKAVPEFAIVFRNLPPTYSTEDVKVLIQETLNGRNYGVIFVEEICLIKSQHCTYAFLENIEEIEEACSRLNKRDILGYRIKVHPLIKGNLKRVSKPNSHFKEYIRDLNITETSSNSILQEKLQEFKNQVKSAAKASNSDEQVSSGRKKPFVINKVFQDEVPDLTNTRPPVPDLANTRPPVPDLANTRPPVPDLAITRPSVLPLDPQQAFARSNQPTNTNAAPLISGQNQLKSKDSFKLGNQNEISNQPARPKSETTFFYSSIMETESSRSTGNTHRSNNILALDNQQIELRKIQQEKSILGGAASLEIVVNNPINQNQGMVNINAGNVGGGAGAGGSGKKPQNMNNNNTQFLTSNQNYTQSSGYQSNLSMVSFREEQQQQHIVSGVNSQNLILNSQNKKPASTFSHQQFLAFEEDNLKTTNNTFVAANNKNLGKLRGVKSTNNQGVGNNSSLHPGTTTSNPNLITGNSNPNIIALSTAGILPIQQMPTLQTITQGVGSINQTGHQYSQNIAQASTLYQGNLIQTSGTSQHIIQGSLNSTQPNINYLSTVQNNSQIPNIPSSNSNINQIQNIPSQQANIIIPIQQNTPSNQSHQQQLPQQIIIQNPQNLTFSLPSMATQQTFSPSTKQSILHKNPQSLEFLSNQLCGMPFTNQDLISPTNNNKLVSRGQLVSRGGQLSTKKLKAGSYHGNLNFINENATHPPTSNDLNHYQLTGTLNTAGTSANLSFNEFPRQKGSNSSIPNMAFANVGSSNYGPQNQVPINNGQYPIASGGFKGGAVNPLNSNPAANPQYNSSSANSAKAGNAPSQQININIPLPSESPPKLPVLPTESPPKLPEPTEEKHKISGQDKSLLMNVFLDDLLREEGSLHDKVLVEKKSMVESKDEKFKKRMAALAKLKKDDDI